MQPRLAKVQTRVSGSKVLLAFPERLDSLWAERQLNRVSELLQEHQEPEVEFDMQAVEYVGSSFLQICLMAAKNLKAEGRLLHLTHCNPGVMDVFHQAGLDRVLDVQANRRKQVR
jgi:anti-anti-sigma factor